MPAGDAIGQLLTQISTLQADATAARERHLRAVAELDNFRRRALREREEVRRQALASLIEELLPVLDTLEHGLEAARAHAAGEAFLRGMEMVQARLLSVLSANGVQPIEPLGQVFDPNWHEAVAHQPDATHAEGTVSAVQRIGYRLGERLIRAAAVIVSSGAATADDAAAD
jgi:molecular chaperone GrpE